MTKDKRVWINGTSYKNQEEAGKTYIIAFGIVILLIAWAISSPIVGVIGGFLFVAGIAMSFQTKEKK